MKTEENLSFNIFKNLTLPVCIDLYPTGPPTSIAVSEIYLQYVHTIANNNFSNIQALPKTIFVKLNKSLMNNFTPISGFSNLILRLLLSLTSKTLSQLQSLVVFKLHEKTG